MIIGGIGGSDSGVFTGDISNSLRFRNNATPYLSKTLANSNRKTFTFSAWIKRGLLGTEQSIFGSRYGTGSVDRTGFFFDTVNNLVIGHVNASNASLMSVKPIALFRDTTSFFHLVIAIDTTQAVNADKVRVYVNGRLMPHASSTYPAQNLDLAMNWAQTHWIGRDEIPRQFDGIMSRVCFVDGASLSADSFGQKNTDTNEWVTKPYSAIKSVVDAGGPNSFLLEMTDPNFATYTIGKDFSSKGNHFTPSAAINVSTNGIDYDFLTDVPGNSYCNFNNLSNPGLTISRSNLNASGGASHVCALGSWMLPKTGKWYWEITAASAASAGNSCAVGVATTAASLSTYPTNTTGTYGFYTINASNASFYNNGSAGSGYTVAISAAAGIVVGVAYDADTGKFWVADNNVWCDAAGGTTGNPSAGTNQTTTLPADTDFYPYVSGYNQSYAANFGQKPFIFQPPTNFKALCQKNLPDITIKDPKKQFDVALYTGDGSVNQFTSDSDGESFRLKSGSAGLIWTKSRSAATGNIISGLRIDGNAGYLQAETTNNLVSPSSAPMMGSNNLLVDATLAGTNDNAATYVSFLFNSGTSFSTNNNGSISSSVSVNNDAGFSIVNYVGTGANATVGHGLSKAPKLVIVKGIDGAAKNWCVLHSSYPGTDYFIFTNLAKTTNANVWNSALPTNQVFSLGTNPTVNTSTNSFKAICFAEIEGFSKIGSYIGNGSADGRFVFCGFRPKLILIKSTGTGHWVIKDSGRNQFNEVNNNLLASSALQENEATTVGSATINEIDFLSNGFKLRDTHSYTNAASTAYVFIAFAETPFKYANAR